MTPQIRRAIGEIAAVYGCRLDQISVIFETSDGEVLRPGDTWTISVKTASKDKRRRGDATSVSAETFEDAVEKAIDYKKWHELR